MRYPGLVLVLAVCGSAAHGVAPPGEIAASSRSLAAPQEKGRYAPRDDCGRAPGAAEFLRKLAEAVGRGDAEAIAALASPDVKLGFAGDDGRERFVAQLGNPGGDLLAEIKRLLPLGCAIDAEGGLTLPWYFAQDMGDIDGYAATIVTGEDVPLYSTADAGSPVKRRISWDLVELNAGLYPEREFQEVETTDGARGFMPTAKLRSLLDYRLLADREGGEWRISAILAGD